jgi:hypothetical protein
MLILRVIIVIIIFGLTSLFPSSLGLDSSFQFGAYTQTYLAPTLPEGPLPYLNVSLYGFRNLIQPLLALLVDHCSYCMHSMWLRAYLLV